MASGKPVLAADSGGRERFSKMEWMGYWPHMAIRRHLLRLNVILADPKLAETLDRRAKTRARDFIVEVYAYRMVKAIQELLV